MNSEPTPEPTSPAPVPPVPSAPAGAVPVPPSAGAVVDRVVATTRASASPGPAPTVRRVPIPRPAIDRGVRVTRLIILICLGIWVWVNSGDSKPELIPQLRPYGVRIADEIWSGAYWALWPAAFVHVDFWHVVLNMMATWTLGSTMERTVGPWKFLLFCLASAPITTGIQLAASGSTGIGFSGVVFAIFGFLWAGVARYPEFRRVIHRANLVMLLGWLGVCFIVTWLDLLPIANAAHVAGLLWGLATGLAFTARRPVPRAVGAVGGLAMAAAVVVSLFWAPWLEIWLGYKAEQAARGHDYEAALQYVDTVLKRDPESKWAGRYRKRLLWLQRRDSEVETL